VALVSADNYPPRRELLNITADLLRLKETHQHQVWCQEVLLMMARYTESAEQVLHLCDYPPTMIVLWWEVAELKIQDSLNPPLDYFEREQRI